MATEKKKKPEFKKIIVSLIIIFVAVAFVGSFAFNYTAKRGGTSNLAVINGEPIPMDSDSLFANIYRQYYESERQKNKDKEITEDKNIELLRKALDTAIQRTLILQYAKKKGIKVSKETVLASIIKKGYYATKGINFDKDRFENTPESDRQRIFKSEEEQLTINLFLDEYFNNVNVSDVEIKSFYQSVDYGKKIEYVMLRYDDIPEDMLKSFYNENPRLFEKAHVSHILIKKDEEKANKILEDLKENPDNFSEIAKKESEDTTKDKGGDLGWFYRKDMVPEFSEVAFRLKKGEISAVVKTQFGYHILKAVDSVKIEPFDEAKFKVKKEYVAEHREEIEKEVSLKSKEIVKRLNLDPSSFKQVTKDFNLAATTTDYITLNGRYILNESKTIPLFELMNANNLTDLVFSTKIDKIGGPVKTLDGNIIFEVVGEKKFDQSEYEKSKDYIANYYKQIKGEIIFNDWYNHTLKHSKVVDNFNKFFYKRG